MLDYDGKEAAMMQPLRARKDYGEESEAAMLKEMPPEDAPPEDVEPVIEDYDKPPVLRPKRGPGRGLGRMLGPCPPGEPPPEGRGRMVCPECMRRLVFKLAALETKSNIVCPYCDAIISSAGVYKEGSEYRAVIAKCLDPNFKALRKMLPKAKEVTLKGSEIAQIHKHLDTIYKKYRELEGKVKTAGWRDPQKAKDNVAKAMEMLGWQGGTVHQVAEETGLTVEQIHDAEDIESLVKDALEKKKK